MSKTLKGNLDKQQGSAGLSSALRGQLGFGFTAGRRSRSVEWEGRTMWLSPALLLLSFPGMFSEGLGAWDCRCRAEGLCPGFEESCHLQ